MPVEIWLGNCETAGNCDKGPCGDGVNTGDGCPPFWTDTKSYPFEYTPGGSVRIAGITINPGETLGFLRGTLSEPVPLAYPVEYFRGEIETPDPIVWDPEIYQPPSFTIDPEIGAATTLWVDRPDGTGSGWPPPPGEPGLRYSSGLNSGFGPAYWIWKDLETGIWWQGTRGSTRSRHVVWGDGYLERRDPTTGALVSTHDVAFSDNDPGNTPDPIDPAIFRWRVLAFPNPRQTLNPEATFDEIPLESDAAEAELQWGKDTFADQITLIANPTTAMAGNISLTIRSACENPTP